MAPVSPFNENAKAVVDVFKTGVDAAKVGCAIKDLLKSKKAPKEQLTTPQKNYQDQQPRPYQQHYPPQQHCPVYQQPPVLLLQHISATGYCPDHSSCPPQARQKMGMAVPKVKREHPAMELHVTNNIFVVGPEVLACGNKGFGAGAGPEVPARGIKGFGAGAKSEVLARGNKGIVAGARPEVPAGGNKGTGAGARPRMHSAAPGVIKR